MRKFDLIIIGGGVAGLVSASGAAQLGARVALIEGKSLGGDCLRTGCVPTKRLVQSAKTASTLRRAREFGIDAGDVQVDFQRVMETVRGVQSLIGKNDDPERFRGMGVEVIIGIGRFLDPNRFEVNGEVLYGKRFIISTGSSPVILPIQGLKETGALTNETALELARLPASVCILGAGPIGIEFAQIFARLGSKVTVVEKQGHILSREDTEVSDCLKKILEEEGIGFEMSSEVKKVEAEGGQKIIHINGLSGGRVIVADEVMSATGRSPNVDGLGLEAAGVEHDKRKGIKVDETLRTTQRHIYACGDVTGSYAFTHVAEYHAGIALGNALFPFLKRKADYRVVPWATFTDPELARVGLTEKEAIERHSDVKVYRFFFKDVDRAVIEGEGKGIIKVVTDKKKRVLGAHLLGPHAGELIHEYVLAMKENIPVNRISQAIHVYPTGSMGVKRACDQYYREKLFTGMLPRLSRWFLRRGG